MPVCRIFLKKVLRNFQELFFLELLRASASVFLFSGFTEILTT